MAINRKKASAAGASKAAEPKQAAAPKQKSGPKRPIEQYEHKKEPRLNNPPVGLVTPDTDKEEPKKKYSYDPHLDPQLVWAGKQERTSFEVPSVSLHVHERIDPRTIIEAVKRKNGGPQMSLFQAPEENPPIREAVEFYKHKHGWSNRLIAGDSLLVMNSLLEKEEMADQVQMVYFDPPYGIRYGSNFQPFVNRRDVKDKDEDLTAEPEMIKAFRDTWELGIHSYLTYIRDRLLLMRDLLSESGSVFVQISDENVHVVRSLLHEVFGASNYVVTIILKKKGGQKGGMMDPINDYILWCTKNKEVARNTFRKVFVPIRDDELADVFRYVELTDGREITLKELSDEAGYDYRRSPRRVETDFPGARLFASENLTSGGFRRTQSVVYVFEGVPYDPGIAKGNCWKHSAITDDGSPSGMDRLARAGRLFVGEKQLRFKRYAADFGYSTVTNLWDEFGGATDPIFVVQTNVEVVKRCMLMTSDPGQLVLDITCGSGTTATVAEEWGRRWLTCDSSRVAITLARQRLMNTPFSFYALAQPIEGVDSGFKYKTAPHITSSTIANNEPAPVETLCDTPIPDSTKVRVSGPFTMEAVPAPVVRSLDEADSTGEPIPADASVARSGATARDRDWRDELLRTGIRGKSGQRIEFTRVEALPATRWLHADGETKEETPQRVVVSFGPDYAPLEQRQVELAVQEAGKLVPKPKMIVFAAFQFDPEAAKDIDELNWPGVALIKAQMNLSWPLGHPGE
jgi:adenine-specific DNA-methyltransferase